MDGENIKKTIRKIPFLLSVTLIIILPIILALTVKEIGRAMLSYGLPIALSLLGVAVIVNLVVCIVIAKKQVSYKKLREKLFAEKDKLIKNFNSIKKRVRFFAFIERCYLCFFALVLAVINAGLVAALSGDLPFKGIGFLIFPVVIYELYVLAGYCRLGADGPQVFLQVDYYNTKLVGLLAHDAMRRCGLRRKLLLNVVPGDNAAVAERKGFLELMVGLELLLILRPEELHAVFLHEFAHVVNKDTRVTYRLGRRNEIWQQISQKKGLFPAFLFRPLGIYIVNNYTAYMFLVSYNNELAADKYVAEGGYGDRLTDALAKIDLYHYSKFRLPPKNTFTDYQYAFAAYKGHVDNFFEGYKNNREKWTEACLRQLPARLDTHPNLPERMENLKSDVFEIDFTMDNKEYTSDISKIGSAAMEFAKEDPQSPAARQNDYIVHKKLIETREGNPELFAKDRLDLAYAYFVMCRYDEALEIFEKKLESSPDNPFALYYKGIILCDRGDDAGIDCLMRIIYNENYFLNVYMYSGGYVQYSGRKELKENLKEKMYDAYDRVLDSVSFKYGMLKKSDMAEKDRGYLAKYVGESQRYGDVVLAERELKEGKRNVLIVSFTTELEAERQAVLRKMRIDFSDRFPDLVIVVLDKEKLPKRFRTAEYMLKGL